MDAGIKGKVLYASFKYKLEQNQLPAGAQTENVKPGKCAWGHAWFLSEEDDADCLGWLKGKVIKFDSLKVRVPQMGWNKVTFTESPISNANEGHFYFVNSYHARPEDGEDLWGTADYNGRFAAAVHRGNIYATQFHVEKSGEAGLAILNGFLNLGKG